MTESPATSLRWGRGLLDLTRVNSGRACLPRQARQPRQPDRRAPIYKPPDCDASLACGLEALSNRVGRSPTGGPQLRPSDPCRRVNAGKPFCVKPGNAVIARRLQRRLFPYPLPTRSFPPFGWGNLAGRSLSSWPAIPSLRPVSSTCMIPPF